MTWISAILGAFRAMGEAIVGAFGWFERKEQRDAGRNAAELEAVEEELRRVKERVDTARRVRRADADELERLLRGRSDQ